MDSEFYMGYMFSNGRKVLCVVTFVFFVFGF